jgi:hypothetical protein
VQNSEKGMDGRLLALTADGLAHQLEKSAFGSFAELIVAICFLAHHKTSAVIPAVKPLSRGTRLAVRTVESHTRSHLDERSALRKLSRILVLHPHERRSHIILQEMHRADRQCIPSFGFPYVVPIAGRKHEADDQHRREHYRRQDEEGLFQSLAIQAILQPLTVGYRGHSVNHQPRPWDHICPGMLS